MLRLVHELQDRPHQLWMQGQVDQQAPLCFIRRILCQEILLHGLLWLLLTLLYACAGCFGC
jgi:hypothetical protein